MHLTYHQHKMKQRRTSLTTGARARLVVQNTSIQPPSARAGHWPHAETLGIWVGDERRPIHSGGEFSAQMWRQRGAHGATTHAAEGHNSNTFVCAPEVKKIHFTEEQKVRSRLRRLSDRNGRETKCNTQGFRNVIITRVRIEAISNLFVSLAQRD